MPRILLLDGNSLLYRGFFAMRALTTTAGLPTNALYSLSLMTLAVLDRFKPDGVVCAFDAPVASFRHIELESYKGTRQSPPDELRLQAPIARDLVKAFGFQLLEEPGFEADDVIGTLAAKGKREGLEIFIVTGDLDALQLVDDSNGPVQVVTTIKGVTETVAYDEAAVNARYGLRPVQVPDFKSLKGDSSDNLPGVPGIGDKTASKLLGDYGTIEKLYEKLPLMQDAKLRAKLEPYQAQVEQCKRLATIVCDIPLDGFEFSLNYQTRGADLELLKPLFDKLEFRNIYKRFSGEASTPVDKQTQRNHEAPQVEALPDSTDAVCEAVGVLLVTKEPIEKADLMSAAAIGLAISGDGESSAPRFVDIDEIDDNTRRFLADPEAPKVTYNAKLLYGVMERQGVEVRGIVFDTLLAAYLINSARTGYPLNGVIADFTGGEPADDDYAAKASMLRTLEPVQRARLRQEGLESLHDKLELPLSFVIAELERAGVRVNAEWLGTLGVEMERVLKEVENEVYNLNEGDKFAIGSTKQLQAVLFEKLKLPHGKKTKTGYSTDSEVLEGLAEQGYEIGAKILQWREVQKLKSTYVDSLPTLVNPLDGKIHTTLSQTVASTGRLSSSNPNLQNIPIRTQIGREIRKAFVADPGNILVAADYSQIELRIFAHITHDPELVRTFAADDDIHRRTAALIFDVPEHTVTADQRRRAKTVNFAVIYGMSSFRLAVELGVSQQIAAEWRKRYFENYPGVKEFAKKTLEAAREKGYVETLLGRRRYVPDITSRVFQFRQAAEREAVNMPVQGTAADIIKLAMLKIHLDMKQRGFLGKMILQVHDELLFECPIKESDRLASLVKNGMEGAYDLGGIHLRVDVKRGMNWSDMEPLALDL